MMAKTERAFAGGSNTGRAGLGSRRNLLALALLLPALLYVLAVTFYPAAYAIQVSLHQTHYFAMGDYVGFAHYLRFFAESEGWNNILCSLVYMGISVVIALPLGLVLALLLNKPIRFRTLFRGALILPWLISQIATALLWGWLVNPQYGPVPYLLLTLSGTRFDFLGVPAAAMGTLVLANVWRSFPLPMLLFLAALQAVPQDMLDAAVVDGATGLRRFCHIILPVISNTTLIAFILLTLHYFNMVTLPLVLTGGGPVGATDVMTLRVFREGFTFYRLGIASAVAVVVFVLNLVFSLVYLRLLRTEPLF
ncbi:MAG TPA: sugar ABC transporter permease [Candidatus Methylomirabilis sp.]|nr:sugar ABC transporter permease [Candidatus Methylomirabilis sp.]